MIRYAFRYGELFKNQKVFPDTDMILDATYDVTNRLVIGESIKVMKWLNCNIQRFNDSITSQLKGKGSIDDSILQQWLEKMVAESLIYFNANIQGSDNNKKRHLADLNERMDVICKDIRRENKEKRRIEEEKRRREEENRKKVLEKSLEVIVKYEVKNRSIRTRWMIQLDQISVLMRSHSMKYILVRICRHQDILINSLPEIWLLQRNGWQTT